MPQDDRDPLKNPFVLFKQHVDASITAGVHTILGLPSLVARNLGPDQQAVAPPPKEAPFNSSSPKDDLHVKGQQHVSRPPPGTDQPVAAWHPFDSQQGTDDSLRDEGAHRECSRGLYGDYRFAWTVFASRSPYSPLVLNRMMPVTPVPNDLPANVDPDLFTWADAFEDLLAVSSAKPLMDLEWKSKLNRRLDERWFMGEPAAIWVKRLASASLTEAYFPLVYDGYRSPQTMEEWVVRRKAEIDSDVRRDAHMRCHFHKDFQKSWSWSWPREAEVPPATSGPGDEASPLSKKETSDSGNEPEKQSAAQAQSGNGAQTEEDLYSFVKSMFTEADHSLAAFMKSMFPEEWQRPSPPSADEQAPKSVAAEPQEDSSTTTTEHSTQEWVDMFGNLHVKTEIRRTSADGTQTSKEVRYSITSKGEQKGASPDWPAGEKLEEEKKWSRNGNDSNEGQRKAGWFWK